MFAVVQSLHFATLIAAVFSSIPVDHDSKFITDAPSLTTLENGPIATAHETRLARIFEAVERGDKDIIRKFVREYSDTNIVRQRNPQGYTALHLAARAGKKDVVEYLLRYGVMPVIRGRNLQTPLHCAAASGHADVVQALVRGQSPFDTVNWLDSSGKTPLRLAIDEGHMDVIRYLARLSDEDIIGLYAAQMVAERNMNVLKALLDTGIRLKKPHLQDAINKLWNEESMWKIMDAADYKSIEEVNFSLALYLAAAEGRAAALKPLISFGGASISYERNQLTPLGVAVKNKHHDCVRELISLGTNTSALQNGISALKVAANVDCAECIDVIADSGFVNKTVFDALIKDGTLVEIALDHSSFQCVKFLTKRGAVITKKEISTASLLGVVTKCDTELLKIHIDLGADINFITYHHGSSPLALAVRNRKRECVQLLLSAGANPNFRYHEGNHERYKLPLYEAIKNDDLDIAKLLLDSGADVRLVGTNNELVPSVTMKELLEKFAY